MIIMLSYSMYNTNTATDFTPHTIAVVSARKALNVRGHSASQSSYAADMTACVIQIVTKCFDFPY